MGESVVITAVQPTATLFLIQAEIPKLWSIPNMYENIPLWMCSAANEESWGKSPHTVALMKSRNQPIQDIYMTVCDSLE